MFTGLIKEELQVDKRKKINLSRLSGQGISIM